MGFGSTAKKLQKVADMAEDLVGRLNELRDRVIRMEETVDQTSNDIADLEQELTEQRALLEAMAESSGIDIDAVVADIETAETEAPADGESGQSSPQDTPSVRTQSDENA